MTFPILLNNGTVRLDGEKLLVTATRTGKFRDVFAEFTDIFTVSNTSAIAISDPDFSVFDVCQSYKDIDTHNPLDMTDAAERINFQLLNVSRDDFAIGVYDAKIFNSKLILSTLSDDVTNESDLVNLLSKMDNTRDRTLIFVPVAEFEHTCDLLRIADGIRTLQEANPSYSRFVLNHKLCTLAQVLYSLPASKREEAFDIVTTPMPNKQAVEPVMTRLNTFLEKIVFSDRHTLLTQEDQISNFLSFAKLNREKQVELAPTSAIEALKASNIYQSAINKLTNASFAISKTQQFNSLQAAILLARNPDHLPENIDHNSFYNLSDMGAGKTLMTVESLYLLDLAQVAHLRNKRDFPAGTAFKVCNKNLLAPKLSIVSSWIDTFKIFYDVEQISDNHYRLTTAYQDSQIVSDLFIASFTVKNGKTTVDQVLPFTCHTSYLIVDELHQLSARRYAKSKFFSRGQELKYYRKIMLSGTLSNLTTSAWYNLIKLFDLYLPLIDSRSNSAIKTLKERNYQNLTADLRESASQILDKTRYLDSNALAGKQLASKTPKINNLEKCFNTSFAALRFYPAQKNLTQSLCEGDFTLTFEPSVIDAPNFELFYQLVARTSVTAQSETVARELFGDSKAHKASVIKTLTTLTNDDIDLLKDLHQLASDYRIYKSPLIAKKISNAILNLNDGLSTKSVYDIVESAAKSNTRFLKYLTDQNLDLLKRLQKSNLIKMPKLNKTPKFKILRKLLAENKDETILVVVNDEVAMETLANVLDLDCFTHKDLADPLAYQDVLDDMFAKQNVVIAPQDMIKSSLDLVQANRLIQYQLNDDISDIIQTQNRINRVGQKRETKAYYLATDRLQANVIDLFLETYKNISVAHKGIVELFVDPSKQINVVNDYIAKAMDNLTSDAPEKSAVTEPEKSNEPELVSADNELALFDPRPYEVEAASEPAESVFEAVPAQNFEQLSLLGPDFSHLPLIAD